RADPRPLVEFASPRYMAAAAQWFRDIRTLSTDFSRRLLSLLPFGLFDEKLLQLVDLASFISVDPLEQLLEEIVDPEKLRNATMKLSILATAWGSGKAEKFKNKDMTDANAVPILLASAAIPGFL